MPSHRFAAAVVALSLAGCYHAEINTGLTPSDQVIRKKFASSWIYGLVPPSVVETAAKCPSGVALVETKHSVLNQLVNVLTFGIYTPIDIKVTCAAQRSAAADQEGAIQVSRQAPSETLKAAIDSAGALAAGLGGVVPVTLLP